MRNADYWRGRFSILEDSAHREAQKTIQDMEELYLDAQRSVQKEIESWYARFAVNNQISLTDARKWLTAGQLQGGKCGTGRTHFPASSTMPHPTRPVHRS